MNGDAVRFVGGARDGAEAILPPNLERPGAVVRLPVMAPAEWIPDGSPLALEPCIEVAEYVVEGWHEPSDAAPRYVVARPAE